MTKTSSMPPVTSRGRAIQSVPRETSLSDAKSAEKLIQHLLHPSVSRNQVDRFSSRAHPVGCNLDALRCPGVLKQGRHTLQAASFPLGERKRILPGQGALRSGND